jgi:hypothetical protein
MCSPTPDSGLLFHRADRKKFAQLDPLCPGAISPIRARAICGAFRPRPHDSSPSSFSMFGPTVIRHPNGPLRPTLAVQLRRAMLRSRRTAVAALSAYGVISLGVLGVLARLSLG